MPFSSRGRRPGWLVAHRDEPVAGTPEFEIPAIWHQGPIRSYGPIPAPAPPPRPPVALDQVRDALATAYYRHVSPTLLARPSIPSILEGLADPYTEYLTPRSTRFCRSACRSRPTAWASRSAPQKTA